jgi:hypothetical protein
MIYTRFDFSNTADFYTNPGYKIVRRDRNKGVVVIYVQEHLSILVRNDLVPNKTRNNLYQN